jgi:hypothetical protein
MWYGTTSVRCGGDDACPGVCVCVNDGATPAPGPFTGVAHRHRVACRRVQCSGTRKHCTSNVTIRRHSKRKRAGEGQGERAGENREGESECERDGRDGRDVSVHAFPKRTLGGIVTEPRSTYPFHVWVNRVHERLRLFWARHPAVTQSRPSQAPYRPLRFRESTPDSPLPLALTIMSNVVLCTLN